jgi:twitching motility protein PilT
MDVPFLLNRAVELGASDIHLNPGRPPVFRVHGGLDEVQGVGVLDRPQSEALCRELCSERGWAEVERVGSTDFGLAHSDGNRFRVNVMRQRGGYAAVLRLIPQKLLSMSDIGLPESCHGLLRKPRGTATSSPSRTRSSTTTSTSWA